MTTSQLLAQANAMNPEITSIHHEETAYIDGEHFIHYIAHVPGDQIFGDSAEHLLATILEGSRKVAA